MKRRSIMWFSSLAVMLTAVFAMGCNKKFDEPPTVIDPGVIANTTIKQLKDAYQLASGTFVQLTGGKIIRGIVVGNDRTGNIYKTIYIQDATAGLMVELNATGLYNAYPVGREIFILTDSLYLANETGMIKLGVRVMNNGTPQVSGIPSTLIDRYIKRGSIDNPVTPKVVTVAELNANNAALQSMLVRLENFEVATNELSKTYADTSVNKSTTNVNFKNCSGDQIIVRSSGYANFAGVRVPQGNGSLTAIFTLFNTTEQLVVRDTSDLQMKGPRCGAPSTNLNYISIQQLRAMYTGTATAAPANTGIRGTIVSNKDNEAAGNYRIQDGSGYGIQLRFTTADNPMAMLGDSMIIDVSGKPLDVFNGDLQVNNVSSSQKVGTGTVVPRNTTVQEITTNLNNWASTVVKLSNVTITAGTPGGTGTNYTITDATGSIVSFIRNTLTGVTMPPAAASITGYVSIFSGTPQITIRTAADIVASTSPLPMVNTTAASAISQTSATSGGNVTTQGTSAVTARGVVWSTSTNPTIALTTKTTDGAGTGTFTSSITGLTTGTKYYVRAYATNASGTAYGNEISFTTGTTAGTVTTEDFEGGSKSGYTAGAATFATGSWMFSEALTGTASATGDVVNSKGARIRGTVGQNNGFIATEFGYNGLKKVTIWHAQTNFSEGTGAVTATFELHISKDGGTTWTKVGNTTPTTKGTLTSTTFDINAAASENVRIKILNTSSATGTAGATNQVRINVDDVKFEY